MSLTCTRLEAARVEPVLEAVDAALGRGLLLARLLLELLRDVSLADVTWLTAATPARPTAPTIAAASER